jgi:hypothetical protein
MFIDNVHRFSDILEAVTQLVEGLSLEKLLTLKLEEPLICLVGTWWPTVSIIEQQSILFLKVLIIKSSVKFLSPTMKFLKMLIIQHSFILTKGAGLNK